jgi:DNA-binding NarL/FixJ family response regulator
MSSLVRVLLVGNDALTARAFSRLASRPEMLGEQLPDVPTAVSIWQTAPAELAPQVIVLASRCLATPDRQALRALMDIAPTVLLGTDPHADEVLEGLRLGARGHVDWPREEDDRLEGALWTVLAGHPALSPLITLCLIDSLFPSPASGSVIPSNATPNATGVKGAVMPRRVTRRANGPVKSLGDIRSSCLRVLVV